MLTSSLCNSLWRKFPLPTVITATLLVATANAQVATNAFEPRPLNLVSEQTLPGSTGADFQEWQRVSTYSDDQGNTFSFTNTAFVEMQTGKHYREGGEWKPSRDLIEPYEGGAVARYGGHKVSFAGNLDRDVVVDLEMPDGQRLKSRVLGLSYLDSASGKNVVFAEARSSTGQIVNSNQVIYSDGFSGVKADVRYTYRKAGLEQDIILRERPPTPESFGLDPKTTRLQVLTEFLTPPSPKMATRTIQSKSGAMEDQELDFGSMRMVRGKAFSLGDEQPGARQVTVAKRWTAVDGRTVLIEEVPLEDVKTQLETLPAQKRNSFFKSRKSLRQLASASLNLPQRPAAKSTARQMQFAKLKTPERGLVLDYVIVQSSVTDYTFKGDTTYLIDDEIYAAGMTTVEGGTVIKFAGNSTSSIRADEFDFKTGPYRPAIFTSLHDNTVGEIIPGSSGVPQTGGQIYLYCVNGVNLRYGHVRFADVGTYDDGHSDIWHSQFVSCGTAVYSLRPSIHNVLFVDCFTAIADGGGYEGESRLLEHVTADSCGFLVACANANLLYEVKNSLFTAVTTLFQSVGGTTPVTYDPFLASLPTSAGVYDVVGAGGHYLSASGVGNTYRDQGSFSITPALLNDLAKQTTEATPPANVLDNQTLMAATAWSPTVARDNGTPDLGYHYDPLDYCASRLNIGNSLTVSAGTAIAFYGPYGFRGSTFNLEGSPLNRNHLVHYSAVQEKAQVWGNNAASCQLFENNNAPVLNWTFADVSCAGGPAFSSGVAKSLDIRHSTLFAAKLNHPYGYLSKQGFTNNILERCTFSYGWCWNVDYGVKFCNNLALSSSFGFGHYCTTAYLPSVGIYNNFFVQSACTYGSYGGTSPVIRNNGFHASTWTSQGTSPKNITTLDFQTGPLGAYYYPCNGGNLSQLIDAGSSTAAALVRADYTARADQAQDTVTVDIGFHYQAQLSLTAECRPDRIALFWELPDWLEIQRQYSLPGSFKLFRSTSPSGPFIAIPMSSNPELRQPAVSESVTSK